MKILLCVVYMILTVMCITVPVSTVCADDVRSVTPYIVIEGKVTFVKARSLVVDGQSYPVSMFVRVFNGDEKGPETKMQIIANIGRIDRARLYILGGKVEKIIVLKNL